MASCRRRRTVVGKCESSVVAVQLQELWLLYSDLQRLLRWTSAAPVYTKFEENGRLLHLVRERLHSDGKQEI